VPALLPDADRVSDQQGANTPGVVGRERLPRGQRPKPLQRQVRGGAVGDADTVPQAEVEHGGAHDRRARNILFVPGQKDAAGRRPRPVLGEDQLLCLEGVLDVLRVSGGAPVEHLIQAAIPFLDLMRRGLVGFRQGAQAVEQASGTARRAADTEKIEQRARRFPIEQAMHERLDVDQCLRLRCPAHQVGRKLDHVADVRKAGLGPQLQQPVRQQRLRTDRSRRSGGRHLQQASARRPRPVGVALFQNLSNHLGPDAGIGLRQRLPMPPVIGGEVPVIENEALRDIGIVERLALAARLRLRHRALASVEAGPLLRERRHLLKPRTARRYPAQPILPRAGFETRHIVTVKELRLSDGLRQQLLERAILVEQHPLADRPKFQVGAGIPERVANGDAQLGRDLGELDALRELRLAGREIVGSDPLDHDIDVARSFEADLLQHREGRLNRVVAVLYLRLVTALLGEEPGPVLV